MVEKTLRSRPTAAQARAANVTATQLGRVGGNRLAIKMRAKAIDASLDELHDAWWNSIACAMGPA